VGSGLIKEHVIKNDSKTILSDDESDEFQLDVLSAIDKKLLT
jgi:hypothetical protein